jgi:uncharacterized membrane protein YedE/YeeE
VPVAAIFALTIALLEHFFPEPNVSWSFSDRQWPAILCGAIVGTVQVPLTLGLSKNAGSSSSFVTMVAAALFFVRNSFMDSKRSGMANWWQVIYVGFAAVGSYLAMLSSSSPRYVDNKPHWAEALFGGVLLIFGARLAAGCTSGHGISGTSHLGIRSFISVAGMFAGGIATAFIAYK